MVPDRKQHISILFGLGFFCSLLLNPCASLAATLLNSEVGISIHPRTLIDALKQGSGYSTFLPTLLDNDQAWVIKDSAEPQCRSGIQYLCKGDWHAAAGKFSLTLSRNPKNAVAYEYRAIARAFTALYEGKDVTKQLDPHVTYEEVIGQQALSDASSAISLHPQCGILYRNRGVMHESFSKADLATSDLEKAVRLAPKDVRCRASLAARYSNLQRVQEQISECTAALSIQPQSSLILWTRGEGYLSAGKYAQSIKDLNDSLKLEPFYLTYFIRGTDMLALGQRQKAMSDFNRAIAMNPAHAKSYDTRGCLYFVQNQLQRAANDHTMAIKLDPTNMIFWLNRAHAYFEMGRFTEALADENQCIRLQPKYWRSYNTRAQIFERLGKINMAIRDADTALSLNPRAYEAYRTRASAEMSIGDFEQAIVDTHHSRELEAALAGQPPDSEIISGQIVHSELSDLAHQSVAESKRMFHLPARRDIEQAIAGFSKVISINGRAVEPYYDRALMYFSLDQPDKAREDLKCFLARSPRNESFVLATLFISLFSRHSKGNPQAWPTADLSGVEQIATNSPFLKALVKFQKNEVTVPKVLQAAGQKMEDQARAHYFIGMHEQLAGKEALAAKEFRWVIEHGDPVLDEYLLSASALKLLK